MYTNIYIYIYALTSVNVTLPEFGLEYWCANMRFLPDISFCALLFCYEWVFSSTPMGRKKPKWKKNSMDCFFSHCSPTLFEWLKNNANHLNKQNIFEKERERASKRLFFFSSPLIIRSIFFCCTSTDDSDSDFKWLVNTAVAKINRLNLEFICHSAAFVHL